MQIWDENSSSVSRTAKSKDIAKSLFALVQLREKNLVFIKSSEMDVLTVECYYEIIKELITALMALDGWKTLSHEMLVGYLKRFYPELSEGNILLIDQLRKTRNDIAYRGIKLTSDYLARNKSQILEIIALLKNKVKFRLEVGIRGI